MVKTTSVTSETNSFKVKIKTNETKQKQFSILYNAVHNASPLRYSCSQWSPLDLETFAMREQENVALFVKITITTENDQKVKTKHCDRLDWWHCFG